MLYLKINKIDVGLASVAERTSRRRAKIIPAELGLIHSIERVAM